MDEMSPMAKIMNSVPGGTSDIIETSYLWVNTENNNVLNELSFKELREVYNLEPQYFDKGYYHVIKINGDVKTILHKDTIKKELCI